MKRLMLSFTFMGDQMIAFFGGTVAALVQAMFYVSGGVLAALGLLVRARNIMKGN